MARREILLAAIGLITWTAVLVWLADGRILFTRPLWVDEWFTVFVAGERSPARAIGHLRAGADGGAGLYHLLVWAVHALSGDLSAGMLRTLSLILTCGALLLVYATLRRRFDVVASSIGVLAVGTNSLVIAHAFEARFYSLWLLCCALFAWCVGLQRGGRRRPYAIATAAGLLVTSHWYGIFTLVAMCGAILVASRSHWRQALRDLAPAAVGLLVFAAVWPLAHGQRSALTVDSWIPAFTFGQLTALGGVYWTSAVPLVAMSAVALAILLRRNRIAAPAYDAHGHLGAVALLSLAVMPVVLAILSLGGQPSMIGRYAIPAALSWGPLAAYAARAVGAWPARIAAIALCVLWFVGFTREANRKRAFAIGIEQERKVVGDALRAGLPLVFQSQHTMYPAIAPLRHQPSPAAFLDMSDSTFDALIPRDSRWYQLNKSIRLERDFARVHATRFGFPRLIGERALDTTPRFLLMSTQARLPRGSGDAMELARATFPGHQVTMLREGLLLLERRDARNLPARNTSR